MVECPCHGASFRVLDFEGLLSRLHDGKVAITCSCGIMLGFGVII